MNCNCCGSAQEHSDFTSVETESSAPRWSAGKGLATQEDAFFPQFASVVAATSPSPPPLQYFGSHSSNSSSSLSPVYRNGNTVSYRRNYGNVNNPADNLMDPFLPNQQFANHREVLRTISPMTANPNVLLHDQPVSEPITELWLRRNTPNQRQQNEHKTFKKGTCCIRTAFQPNQLVELENVFQREKYLNSKRLYKISHKLNLTEKSVRNWFLRRRRLEEEQQTASRRIITSDMSSTGTSLTSRNLSLPRTSSSLASPQQFTGYDGASTSQQDYSPPPFRATEEALWYQDQPQQHQCLPNEYQPYQCQVRSNVNVSNVPNAGVQFESRFEPDMSASDLATTYGANRMSTMPEMATPIIISDMSSTGTSLTSGSLSYSNAGSSSASPQQFTDYDGASDSQDHSPPPSRTTKQALWYQDQPQQHQFLPDEYQPYQCQLRSNVNVSNVPNAGVQFESRFEPDMSASDLATTSGANSTSTMPEVATPIREMSSRTTCGTSSKMSSVTSSGISSEMSSGIFNGASITHQQVEMPSKALGFEQTWLCDDDQETINILCQIANELVQHKMTL